MKKNIIYSFLVLLLLSACDDYLDIRPKGRLIPEKVQDYEKMLNGPRLLINSTPILEILGDNVWPRDAYPWYSDEEKRAYQWADYIWSAEVSTPMNDAYERIFVYNTIINNIDDAIDATNSNTKPVVAEARLARAWEYFYLVNMYGKHFDKKTSAADLGVVLLTKDDITQTIPERSTVKEVYDFVINEIVEIADDLPEESNAIRMNKTTAYAILSRAYLYQGEWQKCADAASVVLGKKADLLDYNEVSLIRGSVYRGLENFPQTEDNPENILVRAFPLYGGVTTYASASAITLFDDNDLRWTLFFTNKNYFGDPLGDGIYFYFRRSIWTNVGLSVPEILLSRAEAYVRLGGESNRNKAMQDVNLLRNVLKMIIMPT
ncbi:MAG: RagB/SusD family nutrient uptake outer membrane protein [Marinifilum sp.]|jgi:hypothetical protein|nr:RagB/SusD family nutrient uptake outer membrane protein [Marinifilum sp.]